MRSEVLLAGSVERAIDGVSETVDAVTAVTHAQIPLWQIGCGGRSVGSLISIKYRLRTCAVMVEHEGATRVRCDFEWQPERQLWLIVILSRLALEGGSWSGDRRDVESEQAYGWDRGARGRVVGVDVGCRRVSALS